MTLALVIRIGELGMLEFILAEQKLFVCFNPKVEVM